MLQRKKLSKQFDYNTATKVVPLFQVTMRFELHPTQAALKYKILRSHYVTLILQRAYLAMTNLPLPLGYGSETIEDAYVLIMTD